MSDYLNSEDSDNEETAHTKSELSEADKEEVLKICAELKAEGNSLYSKQDYDNALKSYSSAILKLKSVGLPQDSLLFLNRSATYLAVKRYVPALNDANIAIEIDPSNWKSHWRKGVALMSMSKRTFRTQQAIAAFEDCLKCATLPENKKGDVQGELSRAQSRLAQQEAEAPPADLSNCVPH